MIICRIQCLHLCILPIASSTSKGLPKTHVCVVFPRANKGDELLFPACDKIEGHNSDEISMNPKDCVAWKSGLYEKETMALLDPWISMLVALALHIIDIATKAHTIKTVLHQTLT